MDNNQFHRGGTMSSAALAGPATAAAKTSEELTVQDASVILSREERFMATVYAMNTLLVQKGFYTQQEFDSLFCRWAKTQLRRPKNERPGWRRTIFSRLFGH
jgi:hypothetical protein